MKVDAERALKGKLGPDQCSRLMRLENRKLHQFVAEAIELCRPESVFVCTDSGEDIEHVRELALSSRAEEPLAIPGHTIHFDGYYDQGRDKDNTRYLLPPGVNLGSNLNAIGREEGLREVRGLLQGSMAGKLMLVRFFCLGPVSSRFSISGVQLTDSAYVAHSEDLLYRAGYEQFRRLGDSGDFFRVLHSSGRLEGGVSADFPNKRIYVDVEDEIVYSVNTQYAGNTVGFKKLSLRLAIRKADREGWLAEHMFIMGVHGPEGRVTYFTGAYPSFCGKTSTAMVAGETIVGDDLAYLRKEGREVRAVNVESGIFGIIRGVNAKDDPVIWRVLTTPGEVIFSNVLVADGTPYWLDDGRDHPEEGRNFSGPWYSGKLGEEGEEISVAHKNARYTVRLRDLQNLDPCWDDPDGVPVRGIIYGGRDSDTWVPVQQSFDWADGVITMGAVLESETTAATLGQEGVRSFQPMSNLDFVSIPLGRYILNHLNFGRGLDKPPLIFSVNYFIRGKDGKFLTGMSDKRVWLKWMERRVHGELAARRTPCGFIPKYADLKHMFAEILGQDYKPDQYAEQFTLRIPENLRKLERVEHIYRNQVPDTPEIVFTVLAERRERLRLMREQMGDYVLPFEINAEG